ncbi:metal ABC transporter substrate-binding protein [Olsenella urininfantis]|uniref:metal ABC transporter substrate-binding protein n=1 Tax=Olsenella urininfantis TaxID=1871033 RepID=UPI0009873C37|nr:metal ABC transporter substrate-binding protein [Olsenella urininfantis]
MHSTRSTRFFGPVMSRRGALAFAAATAPALLAGCAASQPGDGKTEGKDAGSKKIKVIASFYSMYDFASKIAGDRAEVSCLVPSGTEPHDWEPSTTDLKSLEEADVLVYNGAGMEHWVEDTLKGLSNDKLVVVEASQDVKLLELSAEAMEHEEHEHEGHDHDHDHGSTDPHCWLAPSNAAIEMKNICEGLIKADPEGKETYQANFEKWEKECVSLDGEYFKRLEALPGRTIVVSHEAFGYLCSQYGLTQMAIEGIEADSEPDAQKMAEIVEFVKKNNVKVIFTEELVSPKVAQSIAEASGATVEELNPLEGLSEEDIAAGKDYFSVMRSNLDALEKALA